MTTTPGRGWIFNGGKAQLSALGFDLHDDPTDDPGHFLVALGPGFLANGWDLKSWAATRPGIDEGDRTTWHELTRVLYDAAEAASKA